MQVLRQKNSPNPQYMKSVNRSKTSGTFAHWYYIQAKLKITSDWKLFH